MNARALESPKEKALFMLYTTTGLRRDEILSLKPEDIDFSKRMITPDNYRGETKKSWVSFYNEEAEQTLARAMNIWQQRGIQEVTDCSRCREMK